MVPRVDWQFRAESEKARCEHSGPENFAPSQKSCRRRQLIPITCSRHAGARSGRSRRGPGGLPPAGKAPSSAHSSGAAECKAAGPGPDAPASVRDVQPSAHRGLLVNHLPLVHALASRISGRTVHNASHVHNDQQLQVDRQRRSRSPSKQHQEERSLEQNRALSTRLSTTEFDTIPEM